MIDLQTFLIYSTIGHLLCGFFLYLRGAKPKWIIAGFLFGLIALLVHEVKFSKAKE